MVCGTVRGTVRLFSFLLPICLRGHCLVCLRFDSSPDASHSTFIHSFGVVVAEQFFPLSLCAKESLFYSILS